MWWWTKVLVWLRGEVGPEVDTVVRPRFDASRYAHLPGVWLVLLIVLVRNWGRNSDRAPWILAVCAAAVAASLLPIVLPMQTRLFLDARGLGRVDLLGLVRRYPPGRVAAAVRFNASGWYAQNNYLVFVDAQGRRVFHVSGVGARAWDTTALDEFCRRAGVPLTGSYADRVGPYSMNKRVRGMFWWSRAWLLPLLLVWGGLGFVLSLVGPP